MHPPSIFTRLGNASALDTEAYCVPQPRPITPFQHVRDQGRGENIHHLFCCPLPFAPSPLAPFDSGHGMGSLPAGPLLSIHAVIAVASLHRRRRRRRPFQLMRGKGRKPRNAFPVRGNTNMAPKLPIKRARGHAESFHQGRGCVFTGCWNVSAAAAAAAAQASAWPCVSRRVCVLRTHVLPRLKKKTRC